jgi:hypothetical protein
LSHSRNYNRRARERKFKELLIVRKEEKLFGNCSEAKQGKTYRASNSGEMVCSLPMLWVVVATNCLQRCASRTPSAQPWFGFSADRALPRCSTPTSESVLPSNLSSKSGRSVHPTNRHPFVWLSPARPASGRFPTATKSTASLLQVLPLFLLALARRVVRPAREIHNAEEQVQLRKNVPTAKCADGQVEVALAIVFATKMRAHPNSS